jgi:hypothetical protein
MARELTPRGLASTKYEEEAAKWEETGQFDYFSKGHYNFVRMYLWMSSRGAAAEGVSERLLRYYRALRAELKPDGWYDQFFDGRDYCVCGETFRYENLSLCTSCESTFGYCHMPSKMAANGNVLCPRCNEGEIVG